MDAKQHREIYQWVEHWHDSVRRRMWLKIGGMQEAKVIGDGLKKENRNKFIAGFLKGLAEGIKGAREVLEKTNTGGEAKAKLESEKKGYKPRGKHGGEKEKNGFDAGVLEGLDLALGLLEKFEYPVPVYEALGDATIVNLTKVRNYMVRMAEPGYKELF